MDSIAAGLPDDAEILAAALREASPALDVARLDRMAPPADQPVVADASAKWWACDARGKRFGILFHAPLIAPEAVARSCDRAEEARAALGDLGRVIPVPMARGVADRRSFCLWPLLRELNEGKLSRKFQRGWLRCELTRWLNKAVAATNGSVDAEQSAMHFREPLLAFAADERQSAAARLEAEAAVKRLDSGKWRPRTALAHNDLWTGNILVCRTGEQKSENPFGFYIIDWGGSQVAGCPIFDLVVWSGSIGASTKSLRSEAETNASILGCHPHDAMGYLLVALGRLGRNLEHFPEPRYLELCRQSFDRLRSALA